MSKSLERIFFSLFKEEERKGEKNSPIEIYRALKNKMKITNTRGRYLESGKGTYDKKKKAIEKVAPSLCEPKA